MTFPESDMVSAMLVTVFLLATAAQAHTGEIPVHRRGEWLFQACKGAVRWLDSPASSKVDHPDASNFDNCTAYIGGFLESPSTGKACLSDDASSMGTILRVYVVYMEKNPKLLDQSQSVD
jgi:hypothetical protein